VAKGRSSRTEGIRTPLAERALAVDVEDANGARRVELAAVVPGRRYAVGTGVGCDIVVDGAYASRRHCEIWLENGVWWVADTGSTNGIRVEAATGTATSAQSDARSTAPNQAMELAPGALLVLSAHAQGEPRQYPRLSLRPVELAADASPTSVPQTATATPVTPIAPRRRREKGWTITVRMASGVRNVELLPDALPFSVGRSRNQALVIDRAHAEVSGRHFEIVAVDESGVTVVVHGDNGIRVDGTRYGAGAELRWKPGQTLHLGLGQGNDQAGACALTLSRSARGNIG
jgi:pSer/pThr/pTyr-binding forkhead associated (FHA) protein